MASNRSRCAGPGLCANWLIIRNVTVGASSAPPSLTVRTALASSADRTSLSRNPCAEREVVGEHGHEVVERPHVVQRPARKLDQNVADEEPRLFGRPLRRERQDDQSVALVEAELAAQALGQSD